MSNTPVITTIDTSLSDRCNLNCSFCYTHGGHGNPFNQALMDKIFNWAFNQFEAGANEYQKKKGLKVNFYGGEPLVEWENLQYVVTSQQAIAKSRNIFLHFGIVTNMTLLTADKLDWLIENNVSISPSIDGCTAAQDLERRFRDGSCSSLIVYENARRLITRVQGRTCRMTVVPATVQHTFESVVFLTKDIGFTNVNPVLAGGVEWTDEKIEIHKQQIEKVTDWWIDEMRAGRHWGLFHLNAMMGGVWTGKRRSSLCAAGISSIGIDTNGNFYPCHRFCNLDSRPEYCLGNLDVGFTNLTLRDKLRYYDVALANAEFCKDCPAVMGCHSFCIHEMMLAGKGMFTPLAHICKIQPFYWKMAMRAHSILTAENNQLYLSKYNPRFERRREQSSVINFSTTEMEGEKSE